MPPRRLNICHEYKLQAYTLRIFAQTRSHGRFLPYAADAQRSSGQHSYSETPWISERGAGVNRQLRSLCSVFRSLHHILGILWDRVGIRVWMYLNEPCAEPPGSSRCANTSAWAVHFCNGRGNLKSKPGQSAANQAPAALKAIAPVDVSVQALGLYPGIAAYAMVVISQLVAIRTQSDIETDSPVVFVAILVLLELEGSAVLSPHPFSIPIGM
ncbi:hypothetical protein B0H13DRAFT_2280945 [Mycena leptocephala]|nr:hypothetical protein B0H13DRAFT_2280945 [Mycena leptocephala]